MKVSLNWLKQYVDLPADLTPAQIAYDMTLRTVEVESTENTGDKFHDIIAAEVLEVKDHPNADALRICIVDIGEEKPVQIVCGGSNLYPGEHVVVCKPGAEVYWHGESELVKIKETKMRGEYSYGMICGADEVFLTDLFPESREHIIVDLKDIPCTPGQNIADVLGLNDTIIEIDNKSLTNRPDLWGHYGIARELAGIYGCELKPLPKIELDPDLPAYDVEIKEPGKCRRFTATEIENLYVKESPMWMKTLITNCGMRPINAIVDITNYVMMAVGQPSHAYDRTHVDGRKIVVRNAYKDEKLVLLDQNELDLTEDDLVVCDAYGPMNLAGIKGGIKDSVLPDTTGIILEIANFTAQTVRKTGARFNEKTDAAMRYEKNLDTQRVDDGLALSLQLFRELYPECRIVAHADDYPVVTQQEHIDVAQEFLDVRLGKALGRETIEGVLKGVGYEVEFENGIYHVTVPVWRSTGDVSIKDDVLGDIARLLSFESFEEQPLTVKFENSVIQRDVTLERRLREYLAYRCGFNEIFTYPWVDDKYIRAAKVDMEKSVRLATPPSEELAVLRSSLVPGMLESIVKNLRYFTSFRMFEVAQAFEKGVYHESTETETLPVHRKYMTGCIVGKDARQIFYQMKGVLETMASYCHMEEMIMVQEVQPAWADRNAWLNLKVGNACVGSFGLLSVSTMNDAKIKRTNAAVFEINVDLLKPFASRTNVFEHLPLYPLVEKDLSVIVDETVTWKQIQEAIGGKVKELEFKEEYRGNQVPEGKKSIMLRVKIGNDDSTMTSEQIDKKMETILKTLHKRVGAELRTE
ncbi:MAG: phenylalanine--tRNA ligase subunit beta [Solobacterium sp.]|nr:phenylalanine--tRNA ligase subunit beta [Solobacterium sp.]